MNLQNMALEVVSNDFVFENVGDALAYGLPKALFGFAVVFTVLALIWGFLSLFKVFFYTIPNSKKQDTEKKSDAAPEPVPESMQVAAKTSLAQDNSVIAAIIAAITAFRTQNGEGNGTFRVVSFKKRK